MPSPRLSDRLRISHVTGTGDASGLFHIYFDQYYYGTIRSSAGGWRATFQRYGELDEFPTLDEAQRAVFEWFAINYPR